MLGEDRDMPLRGAAQQEPDLLLEPVGVLAAQRSLWQEFFAGINRVARLRTT